VTILKNIEMTIKIIQHLMPWEIDYAILSFTKLKQSSYFLNPEDKICIDIGLNLSSYIINWNKSELSKQYFIDKYNSLSSLLDWTTHRSTIYEGNELWGHLDMQKTWIEPHIDYYVGMCPDMWFHEHLLYYLIESAKQIQDKYFIVTPEIPKLWDWTWDELTNEHFQNIPYDKWNKTSIFDIQNKMTELGEPVLRQANAFKWAGWFDLYSKSFVEELVPIPDEWKGYGPWDFYGMIVSDIAKQNGTNVKEYILQNQIIFEYHPDKENKNNFTNYYKNRLSLNKIENQREVIESKFPYYIQHWKQYYEKIYNNNNN